MNIESLFKIAWKAIMLNKTRTALTMLGIIIGVASVIAMLAIGQGSKESIQKTISSMGANMITIRPGTESIAGVHTDAEDAQTLTLDDYTALKNKATLLTNVSPLVSGANQAVVGSHNWPTTIYGAAPEYLNIRDWNIEEGGLFTEEDVASFAKVAVIGKTVQQSLFPGGESAVGQVIRFKNIPLTVVGVLAAKGRNTFGQDQDDIIIAPYTTVQKRILAEDKLKSIVASSVSEESAPEAVKEVTAILEASHKLSETDRNDFTVSSQLELISTFSATSEMLTLLLVAIAGISLLVGGIGIMNIMYVSVKERTKEIGLRMAIGATDNHIRFQFLIESILISITGGIIGVISGLLATLVVSQVLGWPVSITVFSLLISFAVCTATGVFFGWYPARKAAGLDPIIALRYE